MAKQTVIKFKDFGEKIEITDVKNALNKYAISCEIGEVNLDKYYLRRYSYVRVGTRVEIRSKNGIVFGLGKGQVLPKSEFEEILKVMKIAGNRFHELKKSVNKTERI